MSFFLCFVVFVVAQPEIFSRFLFDRFANETLLPHVGPLTAPVYAVSISAGVARTTSGTGASNISLDWNDNGFDFGFYVSVWFRFRARLTLNETRLLTSQSVTVSVALNNVTSDATLKANFALNNSINVATTQLQAFAVGTTWQRLTVGFVGTAAYARIFKFDASNASSDQLRPTPTPLAEPVRPSTSMVLGGTFYPQQLEFKDLVLFRPRNATEVMTVAFDNQVAREYNPNPVAASLPTTVRVQTATPTMATTTVPDLTAPPSSGTVMTAPANDTVRASAATATAAAASTTTIASTPSSNSNSVTSALATNSLVPSPSASTTAANHKTTAFANTVAAAEPSGNVGPLIGGIVGGVLALIAIVALAVWLHRRRSAAQAQTPQSEYGMIAPVRPDQDGTTAHSEYGVAPSARDEYNDVGDVRRASEYDAPTSKLEA